MVTEQKSFVCPKCHMESFNPSDILYSYCGNCHEFIPHWLTLRWLRLRDLIRSL